MKRKPKRMKDGEWSVVIRPTYGRLLHRIECCDCGLKHLVEFKVTPKGNLRFRAWRDK